VGRRLHHLERFRGNGNGRARCRDGKTGASELRVVAVTGDGGFLMNSQVLADKT
jgi:hypothetical protein